MNQTDERVNILLVDDQPAKLMTYEVILAELGETLIQATSGRDALQHLLKTEVAVVLIDVCMPELDGFELAALIRGHPRFEKIAIIFVSAVHLTDIDYVRGYESGAFDYVPVPVVPELLRAKVKVFAELYRKTRQLERLNEQLEARVAERTAELERSMQLLEQSEQRRSLALAAGRMGSWEWNLESGDLVWDDGQFRLYGVARDGFAPSESEIRRLIHPDDVAIQATARRAALDGESFDLEFRVVRPDGETRWLTSVGAPSFDALGRAARVTGTTLDITERKRAEQALHQVNEDLERRIEVRTIEREKALAHLYESQKIETIGQLTGGVAHDFNNLLMAVLGSLELLRKRVTDDPRGLRLLDNAVQGAERGAALTQRLLAFARRQELKPEVVDIPDLVSGMKDLLKRAVGPSIAIDARFPIGLPPVRVDANQLELALLNLAVNARDAMPNGGSLRISSVHEGAAAPESLGRGDYVRIRVEDDGTGMDAATLSRATDPFFTTKGSGKGTGLGLSMVHGTMLQSGGALQISSRPGEGTQVDLWLPRASAALQALQSAEAERRIEAPVERAERPCTVLIVDDDALVRTGTVAMLEDLGHSAIEVSSGAGALEMLHARGDIDVVLTDQAMPGMTGIELARIIRRDLPYLPVVLASGFADLPGEETGDGGMPRLSKPYRQQDLAAAISDVLRAAAS